MSDTIETMRYRLLPKTQGLVHVSPLETGEDALVKMDWRHVHHLVVLDQGHYLGVISDRDIFRHAMNEGHIEGLRTPVGKWLGEPIPLVKSSTTLAEVLAIMDSYQSSAVPVIYDHTIFALVTESDLLRHYRQMESEGCFDEPSHLQSMTQVLLANPALQQAMNSVSSVGI